ncbi:hypothetical protein ACA910_012892 [Epithemia clementina (nom. ined.)]
MTVSVAKTDVVAVVQRPSASYRPHWQRFQTALITPTNQVGAAAAANNQKSEVHPYQRQYSHVYHQRLTQLAPRCRKAFQEMQEHSQSEKVRRVERLLELEDEVVSFVVGTLVKEPSPNTKDPGEPLLSGTECRALDVLYLEDESGRVALQFQEGTRAKYYIHDFCTGLIVGVQGAVSRGGTIIVEHIVLPSLPPPEKLQPLSTNDAPPFLLLISGIQCGSTSHPSLKRDMLLNFLEGRLGHPAAPLVSRVVVCGGLIANNDDKENTNGKTGESSALSSKISSLLDLDAFLFQITAGAGIPVDILPGEKDPTTANWPQRPLHSSLILQSTSFGLVHRSPNPYDVRHEGCQVIATDGTNVRDLQKHILARQEKGEEEDAEFSLLTELASLRKHVEFGHICPTGPASVPTVPHALSDPMVLQSLPHVFVAGNCSHFATATVNSNAQVADSQPCRLVCLPSFCQTGEAVLLNLNSLDIELLRFEGDDY